MGKQKYIHFPTVVKAHWMNVSPNKCTNTLKCYIQAQTQDCLIDYPIFYWSIIAPTDEVEYMQHKCTLLAYVAVRWGLKRHACALHSMQMHANLYIVGYFWHKNTLCGFPKGKFPLLRPTQMLSCTQMLAAGDPTALRELDCTIYNLAHHFPV